MTIFVYRCDGGVYFLRCARAESAQGAPLYRTEAYRVGVGRTLQQVLDADGRPVEAHAAAVATAVTRLLEYLEACLGLCLEQAPAFGIDGYVLHGTWRLPRAHTAAALP